MIRAHRKRATPLDPVDRRSRSHDLTRTGRRRQQREVDVESNPQRVGDGCQLAECGVSSSALKRGDHRLRDLHTIGELQLREPYLLPCSADALSHELRVNG